MHQKIVLVQKLVQRVTHEPSGSGEVVLRLGEVGYTKVSGQAVVVRVFVGVAEFVVRVMRHSPLQWA